MRKVEMYFIRFSNYPIHIKIYDKCKLIYEKDTYNGMIQVYLDSNKVYKVVANTLYNYLNINILIDRSCYKFNFVNNINRNITFLLTDRAYSGLKIERGDLLLWQK